MSDRPEILCLGVNHEGAAVALRERLAVSERDLGTSGAAVVALPGVSEAVLLSTCNRMEIYAAVDSDRCAELEANVALVGEVAEGEQIPFYRHGGLTAAKHLFAVASGLDSMVLGETEILGQVKKAYAAAHAGGNTGKTLNKLFQNAFAVAKFVRTNSKITRGATSVGAAGVDLAEKIFGDLGRCTVMVMGAGEMGQTVARTLSTRGVKGLIVSNRSHEKAVELASEMGGKAMHLDEGISNLAVADIVITSTSAPHTLLSKTEVLPALRKRRGKPLFIIDIAVPRDVEAEVGNLSGVYLYDMDALQGIAAAAKARRQEQIVHCEGLIEEQMDRLGIAGLTNDGDGRSEGDGSPALPTT